MVIFTIIGALVGAGFASGQEIYLFFYRFGLCGILGIVLCSFIIGFVIYKTFKIINKYKINTYKDFLNYVLPRKWLIYITNISINSFLCVTFFIMIAGFGAYFSQELRYT